MDFQQKWDQSMLGFKYWIQNHTPCHHHYDKLTDFHHFIHHVNWIKTIKLLPQDLHTEIFELCLKAHEVFLGEHFSVAKKMRKLKHKMEILHLDIVEHCHTKEKCDKKIVSESLAELKKTFDEYHTLKHQEKEKLHKIRKETEEIVYQKVQDYLKK